MYKMFSPIAKRAAVIFICICTVLVALNAVASAYFNPRAVVNREIYSLAREYYEDYLYQNLIGDRTGDAIAEELKEYRDSGTGNTYLRQLLLYDSGRRQKATGYFEQDGFTCDRNETYVKYFPDPPYGKEDYHFDIKLVCN
ncbi:hypothetical protein IKG48_00930 [Candidatus Saccharibacteria bacterium]|nr:hypothetical protein [Candidatus Saccharibacteria bacterium]